MAIPDYETFEAQYCFNDWIPGVSYIPTGSSWGPMDSLTGGLCMRRDPIIIHWGDQMFEFHSLIDQNIVVYRAQTDNILKWLLVRRIEQPKLYAAFVDPVDDKGVSVIKCYSMAGELHYKEAFPPEGQVLAWHLNIFIRKFNVEMGTMTNQQKVHIVLPDGTIADNNAIIKPHYHSYWKPKRRIRVKTAPDRAPGATAWCRTMWSCAGADV